MKERIGRRYWISGIVQGVGFRAFAARAARELGVTGWARNLADGRVEVHANGSPQQLSEFEARLRQGPAWADIRGFESQPAALFPARNFNIE